eukprot:TRINITY_DN5243_c0_g1_i1.p1 TRINITY_DN5243_c0_g1~~TRINITY_DN5243_c0_g1_i1.p1  ORF type:complete len:270 (+),score=-61.30 TRINITY_DN5243_c0_g1_i1:795-1604(+)
MCVPSLEHWGSSHAGYKIYPWSLKTGPSSSRSSVLNVVPGSAFSSSICSRLGFGTGWLIDDQRCKIIEPLFGLEFITRTLTRTSMRRLSTTSTLGSCFLKALPEARWMSRLAAVGGAVLLITRWKWCAPSAAPGSGEVTLRATRTAPLSRWPWRRRANCSATYLPGSPGRYWKGVVFTYVPSTPAKMLNESTGLRARELDGLVYLCISHGRELVRAGAGTSSIPRSLSLRQSRAEKPPYPSRANNLRFSERKEKKKKNTPDEADLRMSP